MSGLGKRKIRVSKNGRVHMTITISKEINSWIEREAEKQVVHPATMVRLMLVDLQGIYKRREQL